MLLCRDKDVGSDPGARGNVLLDRLLGAKLHLVAATDYLKYGGDLAAMDRLNAAAAERLREQGRRPYVVPVGGTTPIGTWGYLAAVEELRRQQAATDGSAPPPFDHIVVAAGSGGTVAGLALGGRLARLGSTLHAVNVQHSPEAYYELIDKEAAAMGATAGTDGVAREWVSIHNGGGLGYGVTSKEQLECIARVGAASGVLLDHVYTGKGLFYFCEHARAHPDAFRNKRILFWHTGGLPGLHAYREDELRGLMPTPERFRPPPRDEPPAKFVRPVGLD